MSHGAGLADTIKEFQNKFENSGIKAALMNEPVEPVVEPVPAKGPSQPKSGIKLNAKLKSALPPHLSARLESGLSDLFPSKLLNALKGEANGYNAETIKAKLKELINRLIKDMHSGKLARVAVKNTVLVAVNKAINSELVSAAYLPHLNCIKSIIQIGLKDLEITHLKEHLHNIAECYALVSPIFRTALANKIILPYLSQNNTKENSSVYAGFINDLHAKGHPTDEHRRAYERLKTVTGSGQLPNWSIHVWVAVLLIFVIVGFIGMYFGLEMDPIVAGAISAGMALIGGLAIGLAFDKF